jgi:GT2 family glycosyltransferase
MTTLVFALVHYRNTAAIKASIERLRALTVPTGWTVAIIVADNSGDAPADLGAALKVTVVADGANHGYLGGAAMAFNHWRTLHGVPSWFVIINPDAAPKADALLTLANLSIGDDVAIVAPGVLLGGTTPQNPFMSKRPSRSRMRMYTIAFRSALLTRLLDALQELKRGRARVAVAASQPQTIYAAHGSIMFVRSRFFERGGTLAYRGFMFGEEIHLAEQIRKLGMRVLYAPAMEVIHDGGSTTGRIDAERRREWHRASADVLWEDHFR